MNSFKNEKKKSKEKTVSTEEKDYSKCFVQTSKNHHDDCLLMSKPCPFHGGRFFLNVKNKYEKEKDCVVISFHPTLKSEGTHLPDSSLINHQYQCSIPKEYTKELHKHRKIQTDPEPSLRCVSRTILEEKIRSNNSERINRLKKLQQCFHSPCNSIDQKIRSTPSSLEKLDEILREDVKRSHGVSIATDKTFEERYSKERKSDYADIESNIKYLICNQSDEDKSSFKNQLESDFLNFKVIQVYPVRGKDNQRHLFHSKQKEAHATPDYLSPTDSKKSKKSHNQPSFFSQISRKNESKNEVSSEKGKRKSMSEFEKAENEKTSDKNLIKTTSSEKSLSESSASLYFTPFILRPENFKDEEDLKLPVKPVLASKINQTSNSILPRKSDKSIQVEELRKTESQRTNNGGRQSFSTLKNNTFEDDQSVVMEPKITPVESSCALIGRKLYESHHTPPIPSTVPSPEKISKTPTSLCIPSPEKISKSHASVVSDSCSKRSSKSPVVSPIPSTFILSPSPVRSPEKVSKSHVSIQSVPSTTKIDESPTAYPMTSKLTEIVPLSVSSPEKISKTPVSNLSVPSSKGSRSPVLSPIPSTCNSMTQTNENFTQTELCIVPTVSKLNFLPSMEDKCKIEVRDVEVQTSFKELLRPLRDGIFQEKVALNDKSQQTSKESQRDARVGPSMTDFQKPLASASLSSVKSVQTSDLDYLFAPTGYRRSRSDGELYEKKHCNCVVYETNLPGCNCCCKGPETPDNEERTDSQATYDLLNSEKAHQEKPAEKYQDISASKSMVQIGPRKEVKKSSCADLGDLIKIINDNFRRMSQKLLETKEHPCCQRCVETETKLERFYDSEARANLKDCYTQTSYEENLTTCSAVQQPGGSPQKKVSSNQSITVCNLCSRKLNVVLVNASTDVNFDPVKTPTVEAETLCDLVNPPKMLNKKQTTSTVTVQPSSSSSTKSFLDDVVKDGSPNKSTFGKALSKRPLNSFVLHERRLSKSSQSSSSQRKNVIFKPNQNCKKSTSPSRTFSKMKSGPSQKKNFVYNDCAITENKLAPAIPEPYETGIECVCIPQTDICPSLPNKPWPGTRNNCKKPGNNNFSYSFFIPTPMPKDVLKPLQEPRIKCENTSRTIPSDFARSFKRNFDKELEENIPNEKKIKSEIEKEKSCESSTSEVISCCPDSMFASKEKFLPPPTKCVSENNTYLSNCLFNLTRPENEPENPFCFYKCGVCKSLSCINPNQPGFPSLFFKPNLQESLKSKHSDVGEKKKSNFECLSLGKVSLPNSGTVLSSKESQEIESEFSEKCIRMIREFIKKQEKNLSKTEIQPTDLSSLRGKPSWSNSEGAPSNSNSLAETTSKFFNTFWFRGDAEEEPLPKSDKKKLSRKKKRKSKKGN